MILIDTHAHLNFAVYQRDRDRVIKYSQKENVWMVNVGTNYQTSKIAVEISKKYKNGVFVSVGLHPINFDTGLLKMRRDKTELNNDFIFEREFEFKKYEELVENGEGRVVAIGEIGFDYWYRPKSKKKREDFKEKQIELFRKEVSLAKKFKLPLILHCRLGYDDLILELKDLKYKYGGVVHCFCGNWEEAKNFLEMGYYLGFNGIIFKMNLEEVIKKTPINRILVETDCPFLTPPSLGEVRNEPVNVKYVIDKISQIKNVSFNKIAEKTTENAISLFKLK